MALLSQLFKYKYRSKVALPRVYIIDFKRERALVEVVRRRVRAVLNLADAPVAAVRQSISD